MFNLFIYSVTKYLLSTYCVLSTVLGTQQPSVRSPCLCVAYTLPGDRKKTFKKAILKFMLIGVKWKKNLHGNHSIRKDENVL